MKAIRATFFLLALANLLLFAYGQGYFGRAGSSEADRLASQLEPERIRIVGKGQAPAPVEAPRAEAPREECRAFAGLAAEPAQQLVDLLRDRDGQLQLAQRPLEEPTSWWVHIPPQSNRQQAEKKAVELKELGIQEFFVVQEDGPNRYAVSLGLYKSAQGAKDRLETLQRQGVRSARIEARETPGDKLVVEARGTAERLKKAFAGLPVEFAAASAGVCAVAK